MNRIAFRVGASLLSVLSFHATAATQQQLDDARNRGLAWLVAHQSKEGSWSDGGALTDATTAMSLSALARAGILNSYTSSAAGSYLSGRPLYSTDAIARSASALAKLKINTTTQTGQLLALRNTIAGKAWGAYSNGMPTTVDTALALEAFYETGTAYADAGTTVSYLAANAQADGGAKYARETRDLQSRLIPTATLVRVLSKYHGSFTVDNYIDGGVSWLVARKRGDGGYSEDASAATSSVFDSALVYSALTEARALNVSGSAALNSATTTAYNQLADYLIAQQSTDGAWSGSALVTAAVLVGWPTAALTDTDKDGMPDGVETALGTSASQVDSRYLAKGNGMGVQGTTYATSLGSVAIDQSLSKPLPAPSGVTPSNWTLVSGSLPPGVSISVNGTLTGIARSGGTFTFIYGVTGADGTPYQLPGQLIVTVPPNYEPPSRDTPTLPEWGLLLLGGALLLSMMRRTPPRWAT